MDRIWIKNLKLINFRNIKIADIDFSRDINIISGENAQGKTSLLESIWLLSGAKSFRTSKDKDLINLYSDIARVTAVLDNNGNEKTFEVIISNKEGKKGRFAKINNGQIQRAISLWGNVVCVVFAPSHLSLVSGAPSLRRKLVDSALCQLYPNYLKAYRTFDKYLNQKNSLLKMMKDDDKEKLELLDIYNSFLAKFGYEIFIRRREYLNILFEKAGFYYNEISKGKEKLSFLYSFFSDNEEDMKNKLNASIKRDIKMGHSTVGVQREDIEISINDIPAKDFASQGQQRSIVLALKLAESDIFSNVCKTDPIILLDDVLSELDYSRQEYLLNHIENKQVFISSCDEDRIKLAKSKKFKMIDGEVVYINQENEVI